MSKFYVNQLVLVDRRIVNYLGCNDKCTIDGVEFDRSTIKNMTGIFIVTRIYGSCERCMITNGLMTTIVPCTIMYPIVETFDVVTVNGNKYIALLTDSTNMNYFNFLDGGVYGEEIIKHPNISNVRLIERPLKIDSFFNNDSITKTVFSAKSYRPFILKERMYKAGDRVKLVSGLEDGGEYGACFYLKQTNPHNLDTVTIKKDIILDDGSGSYGYLIYENNGGAGLIITPEMIEGLADE